MANNASANIRVFSEDTLDRMFSAVAMTKARIERCTKALDTAAVPFAIASDHAVAEWVRSVDESAVRNAVDFVVVIRRDDFEAAERCLKQAELIRESHASEKVLYWDPGGSKFRPAVELIFAGEKRRPHHIFPIPDAAESRNGGSFRILELMPLLEMALTGARCLDHLHVRDLIDVGLVDESWLSRLPPELATRLKQLLDDPEG